MPPAAEPPARGRRFVLIAAGAAAVAAALGPGREGRAGARPLARWRGVALGAEAQILLDHPEPGPLLAAARDELARIEAIFSLHRPDSALARLNREGRLDAPPPELRAALALARRVHALTGGAFDPTVQPLWRLMARSGGRPSAAELAEARARIGLGRVIDDGRALRFAAPGMALTFNGLAQGLAADRVAALLRAAGLRSALIDAGEHRALGARPDGGPWRIGLAPPPGAEGRRAPFALRDAALATSAPAGLLFAPSGPGHILDPRPEGAGPRWAQVSVRAPSAALADALSTALCLMDEAPARAAARAAGAQAWFWRAA
ncbi:FAD:protein FMN transferase [Oceanicella actignis]|uniref:FAD:protein FMN transferase n=1 Tax=Oceanicella actignis TaxID=1189325 RepID=A0A1M7TRL2_9RHOB|nr:FAD:protein FMN transferase [Oceanicella actignis]SET77762.1 thiamine biosynthesis lipoprotein [Oceanicella actignis]SHN73399.1 thiamine biosynthesis lipoprotein [Oceanicella actignis]